jgi:Ca2+-transporting ATPase
MTMARPDLDAHGMPSSWATTPVGVDAAPGLSAAQAAQRLAEDGPNALPVGQRRKLLSIAAETAREPMFLLLLAAATLYLVFGDLREGLTLLGFVVFTLALTLFQEGRTERAIEALRDLTSPRARVIRDGQPNASPDAKWCAATC